MIGTIATPHADIELGVGRQPLRYLVRTPAAGLDRRTGLALFIVGYGMEPCGGYAQKLLAHLSDRHNCVAVSVDYFGANFWAKSRLLPFPDFFLKLREHYGVEISAPPGVNITELVLSLARLFRQNGISRLHDECQVVAIADEYNSMGFLPALDGHDLSIIDEGQLDGRLFKTLEHGMRASLRRLFDLSYDKFLANGGALADSTDFDLGAEHCFDCSESYALRFSGAAGVQATLKRACGRRLSA